MISVLTVIGTRPHFIKAAPVSQAFKQLGINETLVHTGQHYDHNMSEIFFKELNLPSPSYNLEIGSGSHAYQTGEGLQRLEKIMLLENPDLVLVYGDTNATLSGALAAAKLHIPVAHVEAGIRSFNKQMAEEMNRIMVDHISTFLFTPTQSATQNLAKENLTSHVYQVGDVMLDAITLFSPLANENTDSLMNQFNIAPKQYLLLTLHRAENTANQEAVKELFYTLETLEIPIIFPAHPRFQTVFKTLPHLKHIQLTPPLGYLDILALQKHARLVLTDSGGMQKESAFLQTPCITLREDTEWPETLESGWNHLVGLSVEKLMNNINNTTPPKETILHQFGNGHASKAIAESLTQTLELTKLLPLTMKH